MRRIPEPDFIAGNQCRLLRDGEETFPAMLEAIGSARRFIHLEVFRFRDDAIGRLFEAALTERAAAGVEVRILIDGYGCIATPWAFFDRLRRAGARFTTFRPVTPWSRGWGFYRRDHRKILVVDGQIGFAGGLNLDLCHASKSQGGAGWRDTHLRVTGPAVCELDRAFWDTWFHSAEPDDCPSDLSPYAIPAEPAGPHHVQIVANRVHHTRSRIRRAYLQALANARQHVWVTNPYFLPDAGFLRALTDASARGVDVRLLVPEHSDVVAVDIASRPILRALVKRGIRVFHRLGTILHAKTAVIDGNWSTVGSCNLDAMSFQNLELNANIRDSSFAGELSQLFLDDLRCSRELRPTRVADPVHLRFAEWTLHGLRHWL